MGKAVEHAERAAQIRRRGNRRAERAVRRALERGTHVERPARRRHAGQVLELPELLPELDRRVGPGGQRLGAADARAVEDRLLLVGAPAEAAQEEPKVRGRHRERSGPVTPATPLAAGAWLKLTSHWPTLPFRSAFFNAILESGRDPQA